MALSHQCIFPEPFTSLFPTRPFFPCVCFVVAGHHLMVFSFFWLYCCRWCSVACLQFLQSAICLSSMFLFLNHCQSGVVSFTFIPLQISIFSGAVVATEVVSGCGLSVILLAILTLLPTVVPHILRAHLLVGTGLFLSVEMLRHLLSRPALSFLFLGLFVPLHLLLFNRQRRD
jgi:hypothetical protein